MTDPFDIEAASGGGADFIPKDRYRAWGDASVPCLCKIRLVKPKGTMLPGFSNACDPVVVDLLVMTDPPVVYRNEEMTNAGMTNKLRTREVTGADGKPVTVDRAPGQLVAGTFGPYTDRYGNPRTGINPATDAQVEMFRQLARQHGDLFEYFDRMQLARAAALVNGAANGTTAAALDALPVTGTAATSTAAPVTGDAKLPF